jgi:CDP-glucose 4,6-dehydratase
LEDLGMTTTAGFWTGRSVLLTGHTGFKGSWLSLWLARLGAAVTGYALPAPTSPSLFADAGVEGVLRRSTIGDVRDLRALSAAFESCRPSVVLHLAAQALVRDSYDDPIGTFATNVMGTANVLEAARRCPSVEAVVVVTTDKCYENREWAWGYREIDPMGGHDPYSSSKGCAELVTASYRRSFFTRDGAGPSPASPASPAARIASARAGNVFGGGDWAKDRLIPDIVRAHRAGTALEIRSPAAIRPWQFVLEPLSGYIALAERLVQDGESFAEAFNFGPDDRDARPVGWLESRFSALLGRRGAPRPPTTPQPHEATYLKLDCSKARQKLGWSPRLPLDQALAWTADWYRAQADGQDLRALCHSQIASFERLPTV